MNKEIENGINSPSFNDNRNYNYSSFEEEFRSEYKVIAELVKEGSSVIDLGCGNGSLLAILKREKSIIAKGVEISKTGVKATLKKGVDVIIGRIDEPLPFEDNSFDYSICNVTIQMVMYPEILLNEMKRISHYQIISFPNFAFYKNRLDLLINGRMPTPMLFNYKWYSTGHIHQLSINDFEELIKKIAGLKIVGVQSLRTNSLLKDYLIEKFPNLFMLLPIYLMEKE